ncbi:DUF3392 domain-containing protein [Vibrio ostreicida]|uniref:DUF3392 domain-containing protein n=1 Tax=Vibrio ostreicida TaxID=526588 RepID=A0ABT8BTF2_9VIBR|nr:DUF3392 domain-containing protein [Vibrio ostreicida]MDN3610261.1 DUF3392 domain-containing protein [Vibrio ostreicida]NPD07723.1 DUF3392 domain-containing protein [Vibrio ostreicida]
MMIFEFLSPAGKYLLPYIGEISLALVACVLVMAGGEINAFLRSLLRNQHFVLRTFVFILINAFGYSLIIINATPYLSRTLRSVDAGMMFSIVFVSFILIGLWAQRNRQI